MRRYIFSFFIISLFIVNSGYSQTTNPSMVSSCEQMMSSAVAKLESLIRSEKWSEIENILHMIETSCGTNEFTERTRIIMLIQQNINSESAIKGYLNQYHDDQLIDRLEAAADANYQNIYLEDKEEYNYVPLRSSIDSILIQKSAEFIGSEKYNLNDLENTIAYLFSDHIATYITLLNQAPPKNNYAKALTKAWNSSSPNYNPEIAKSRYTFYISAGSYMPAYAVNPVFRNSMIYGVGFNTPLSGNWNFDVSAKYRPNRNSREFLYSNYNEQINVKSNYTIMTIASVGYKVLDLGPTLLTINGGLGLESTDTGLQDYFINEFGYENVQNRNINILNLTTGVTGWKHLLGKTMIGLKAAYIYSPYSSVASLLTPIVSNYLNFELLFRF